MANNVQNVAAGKPKVGGSLWTAPVGTTLPTDATTALDAAFECLGYISEDGFTNETERDTDVVKAWGGDKVLVTDNGVTDTFGYTLIEVLAVAVLKHVYGPDNVSGTLAAGITVSVNSKETPEVVLVAELVLRGAVKRIVVPLAHVTEVGEITYKDDEAVGYETTVTALPDASGNTHYEYIKAVS